MSGFTNDVVVAQNVDFSGAFPPTGRLLLNGQMLIGSTAANAGGTHINVGTLTSPNGTIAIGYSSPNITLQTTAAPVLGVVNLGISYSAGTFTVLSATGTALSGANPAYVTLQNPNSPGQLITVAVVANQTFTDAAGSGNTNSWQAGVSPTDLQGGTSSNWAQDMPFFLYAVLGTGGDIAFMIGRNPAATLSPAAGGISKAGTILNVNQTDMFSLAGGTIANYASRPALCIGSFRMRNVVSSGNINYTVQALSVTDGIGQFQQGTGFVFPTGVNGAVAGFYFGNAGTPATFSTNAYTYKIQRDGTVYCDINLTSVNNSPSGSNVVQLVFPYANRMNSQQFGYAPTLCYYVFSSGIAQALQYVIGNNATATNATNGLLGSGSSTAFINTSFHTGDALQGFVYFPAFS